MRAAPGDRSRAVADRAEVAQIELAPSLTVELMRTWYQRQAFPRHTHEYFTIALGLRGAGVVWFRGADRVRRLGELVMLPPGEVHTGAPAPGSAVLSYLALHVPPSVLTLCAQTHGLPGDSPSSLAAAIFRDPDIGRELRRLDAAMNTTLDSGAAAESVISALDRLVSRYAGPGRSRERTSDEPRLVRIVRQIIDDCYADSARTSLAMLSASCGVTPFHIVRLFTRSVGISPHRYLVQVRVRHARELLARGIPPSFVAATTGFADQSHLTAQFKRLVGTTPGSYQRCLCAGAR
jgi:AraC-like DNA-binding protein/quercetin dioxygenase-like cupin family protein